MSFQRAISLAKYNWPLYIICLVSVIAGLSIAAVSVIFTPLRVVAALAGLIAIWYALASFFAFHLMFDRSEFLSGRWLTCCASETPQNCLQLSVCVEETTLPIQKVFPNAQCTNLDLFDDQVTTEPAIARAKLAAGVPTSLSAPPDAFPVPDNSYQFTVVTLAAHEIRNAEKRSALFSELARVTSANGRIVIAEHLRNIPALLAFGPGIFHFYPHKIWRELATSSELQIELEFNITPFIHVFVLKAC